MFTQWGYEIDGDKIPFLVDEPTYHEMTGNRYAADLRVRSAISAASDAIRNACGWHVTPSMPCVATVTAQGRLVKLPANLVTSVDSVTDGGVELSYGEYEWSNKGLLRRACFREFSQAWDGVTVAYTAGYDAEAVAILAELVKQIVEGVLSMPVGVASESAGGVSISYTTSAASVAGAMTSQMTAQLAPFKLVSAHAA